MLSLLRSRGSRAACAEVVCVDTVLTRSELACGSDHHAKNAREGRERAGNEPHRVGRRHGELLRGGRTLLVPPDSPITDGLTFRGEDETLGEGITTSLSVATCAVALATRPGESLSAPCRFRSRPAVTCLRAWSDEASAAASKRLLVRPAAATRSCLQRRFEQLARPSACRAGAGSMRQHVRVEQRRARVSTANAEDGIARVTRCCTRRRNHAAACI